MRWVLSAMLVALSILLAGVWARMPPAWDLRSPTRQALGWVVGACALNDRLTGSPLPCQTVERSGDPLASHVLLREPSGRRRLILAPIAPISGLEDERLLTDATSSLFVAAWDHRRAAGVPASGAARDMALAVNARYSRTQDHLHIHIACLSAEARAVLDENDAMIPTGRFGALADPIGANRYWVRHYQTSDPTGINPFAAVADGVSGARDDMALHNIAVAAARVRGGLYVLASRTDRDRFHETGAEHLLDPACGPIG